MLLCDELINYLKFGSISMFVHRSRLSDVAECEGGLENRAVPPLSLVSLLRTFVNLKLQLTQLDLLPA